MTAPITAPSHEEVAAARPRQFVSDSDLPVVADYRVFRPCPKIGDTIMLNQNIGGVNTRTTKLVTEMIEDINADGTLNLSAPIKMRVMIDSQGRSVMFEFKREGEFVIAKPGSDTIIYADWELHQVGKNPNARYFCPPDMTWSNDAKRFVSKSPDAKSVAAVAKK